MAEACATTGSDTRNLRWKDNNKGSTLLQKMGWKQGQALGSKHRKKEGSLEEECTGEGLKIVKRPDGLGLGMARKHINPESTSHGSFSQVLEKLKQEHSIGSIKEEGRKSSKKSKKRKKSSLQGDDNGNNNDNGDKNDDKASKEDGSETKKSKKSSKKKSTVFATNKITNGRVRESKFAAKSATDMACIFGKEYSTAEITTQFAKTKKKRTEQEEEQRRQRKEERRRKRKEAKEQAATTTSSSPPES